MRTLLLALVVTVVLWWLLRPRRTGRRADRYAALPEPTYKTVKTFRTLGGVDTTVGGHLAARWSGAALALLDLRLRCRR